MKWTQSTKWTLISVVLYIFTSTEMNLGWNSSLTSQYGFKDKKNVRIKVSISEAALQLCKEKNTILNLSVRKRIFLWNKVKCSHKFYVTGQIHYLASVVTLETCTYRRNRMSGNDTSKMFEKKRSCLSRWVIGHQAHAQVRRLVLIWQVLDQHCAEHMNCTEQSLLPLPQVFLHRVCPRLAPNTRIQSTTAGGWRPHSKKVGRHGGGQGLPPCFAP